MGVKAIAIQADSVSADAVTAAVEKTVQELGGIDILVNNAGVGLMAPIEQFAWKTSIAPSRSTCVRLLSRSRRRSST